VNYISSHYGNLATVLSIEFALLIAAEFCAWHYHLGSGLNHHNLNRHWFVSHTNQLGISAVLLEF
jgi:imidazole glycerol phosphate synthase subunit HisF